MQVSAHIVSFATCTAVLRHLRLASTRCYYVVTQSGHVCDMSRQVPNELTVCIFSQQQNCGRITAYNCGSARPNCGRITAYNCGSARPNCGRIRAYNCGSARPNCGRIRTSTVAQPGPTAAKSGLRLWLRQAQLRWNQGFNCGSARSNRKF